MYFKKSNGFVSYIPLKGNFSRTESTHCEYARYKNAHYNKKVITIPLLSEINLTKKCDAFVDFSLR